MGRASPRQEPVKGISEGGKSIRKGPIVEKELSVFLSRPVWLEPREGCWLGGLWRGGGEHWTDRREGGRLEPDRQGLVFEFSSQCMGIGEPSDGLQESAVASSVSKRPSAVGNEPEKHPSNPALFRCLIPRPFLNIPYSLNALYWPWQPVCFHKVLS